MPKSNAQIRKQTTYAKLVILEAVIDGLDYTDAYIANNAYLALYDTNGKPCFANKNKNSQSYGYLYDSSVDKVGGQNVIRGIWEFNNTYDENTGAMYLIIIIDDQMRKYQLEIRSKDTKDKYIYRGDIERASF